MMTAPESDGLLGGTAADFCLSRCPEHYWEGMWDKPPCQPGSRVAIPNGQDSLPIRLVGSMDRHARFWCENSPAPSFIPPCLPGPSQQPSSGSAWVHEIKHDGYRLMERVVNLKPQEGRFRTLVLDPPWPTESAGAANIAARGNPQYALMTPDQILALPVASWAEGDCHLYLWVTNSNMPLACKCMAAWGFQHKSILTWIKPRFGLGEYFRGSTEHVLFGVRGKLGTRSRTISTHFEAPVGAHSEKPERFYEIVREASYLPAGEAFQRKAREGFVNLYQAARAAA
jgi:N6-adenosine-specific RNA methylase IME4